MRKITLILGSLVASGCIVAQDGVELTAKISDYNVRANKYVGINSYHTVSIKNITDKTTQYKYTWCLQFDKHNQCYHKVITLKPDATFGDHNVSYKHVGKEKSGQYPIIASTSVNDIKTEASSILTVY